MSFSKEKQKKFILEPDRLIYGDDAYSYDEIKHISFVQSKTDVRLNFLPVDEVNESYLELTMRNGVEVVVNITEKMYLIGFSQDKNQELNDLFDAFVFLSEITFRSRLLYYVNQVERLGYFVYAEGKFYPDDKITMPDGKSIKVSEHSFFKSGYYIKIKTKPREDGFFAKVRKKVVGDGYDLPIATDRDVIFALLDRYYGLRW